MKCDLYVGRRCVDGTCPNVVSYEIGEDLIPCSKCDLCKPCCELCYWASSDGPCDKDELVKYLERWERCEILLDTSPDK